MLNTGKHKQLPPLLVASHPLNGALRPEPLSVRKVLGRHAALLFCEVLQENA